MGLSSKLVPSDGLEFEYWNNSRTPLREQMVGTDQTPRSAAVKRQLPQDPPPNRSEPLKCPRCESTNTKFCYYNNYSKTQPRHFCKACKRHWTKGGTLRNVPVGGSRKNKRLKTAPATSSVPTTTSMTAAAAAAASTTTFLVVDKHNKPATNDEMFAHPNIGNSILTSPHRDILNSVQFPVSTLSDSMITRVVPAAVCGVLPSSLQAGVAREALASPWSWEDIEPLISINQGSGWDDSNVQLP